MVSFKLNTNLSARYRRNANRIDKIGRISRIFVDIDLETASYQSSISVASINLNLTTALVSETISETN